jgi:hypothetical protein
MLCRLAGKHGVMVSLTPKQCTYLYWAWAGGMHQPSGFSATLQSVSEIALHRKIKNFAARKVADPNLRKTKIIGRLSPLGARFNGMDV